MIKQIVSLGVAAVLVVSAVVFNTASTSNAVNDKVTICHRTDAVKNPYVQISVDADAVDGDASNQNGNQPDHYGEHQGPLVTNEAEAQAVKDFNVKFWGDIIPPVGSHSGLNWTSEGQAIYRNGCNYVPPVVTANPCTAKNNILVTNKNEQGFNYSPLGTPYADTRADGRYEYVPGALKLETLNPNDASSTNKVVGARAVNIPLSQYGGAFNVNFNATYGTILPGINVRIDPDGAGPMTTLVTLVAEPGVAGYKTFWTNTPGYLPPSMGGQGGSYAGDQNDVLALWPNAVVKVEAFSLGSGVGTDGTLISWSTPCNTYTYDYIKDTPVVLTATASVSTIDATCEVGETLVYGAISNATFNASSTANGTTGPAAYSVTADAVANAKFAGDQTSVIFTGTLDGKLTGTDCVLGEETPTTPTDKPASTPTSTGTPAVLPDTNAGSATTVFGFVVGLLTVIGLGGAALRKTLYRGL